jgi:hypothetical protein
MREYAVVGRGRSPTRLECLAADLALLNRQIAQYGKRKALLANIPNPVDRRCEEVLLDEEMRTIRESHEVLGRLIARTRR